MYSKCYDLDENKNFCIDIVHRLASAYVIYSKSIDLSVS